MFVLCRASNSVTIYTVIGHSTNMLVPAFVSHPSRLVHLPDRQALSKLQLSMRGGLLECPLGSLVIVHCSDQRAACTACQSTSDCAFSDCPVPSLTIHLAHEAGVHEKFWWPVKATATTFYHLQDTLAQSKLLAEESIVMRDMRVMQCMQC